MSKCWMWLTTDVGWPRVILVLKWLDWGSAELRACLDALIIPRATLSLTQPETPTVLLYLFKGSEQE